MHPFLLALLKAAEALQQNPTVEEFEREAMASLIAWLDNKLPIAPTK